MYYTNKFTELAIIIIMGLMALQYKRLKFTTFFVSIAMLQVYTTVDT